MYWLLLSHCKSQWKEIKSLQLTVYINHKHLFPAIHNTLGLDKDGWSNKKNSLNVCWYRKCREDFFIRARESTRYERGGNWHHSITNCEQFVKINTTISIIWFTHRMRKTTTGSFYIDSTFKRFSEKYVRNYKISSNTQKLWCF